MASSPKAHRNKTQSSNGSNNNDNNRSNKDDLIVVNARPVNEVNAMDRHRKIGLFERLRLSLVVTFGLVLTMMIAYPFQKKWIPANTSDAKIHHNQQQHLIDINDPHPTKGKTLLLAAVERGSKQVVQVLVEQGANVNGRDSKTGRTPLMEAASRGDLEMCKLLLSMGANINGRDHLDMSALFLAVNLSEDDHDVLELIEVLIENGANVHSQGNGGRTPLHVAAAKGGISTVTLLLDAGVNVNTQDYGGSTALHVAVSKGSAEVIHKLLNHGANPNIQDNRGNTPLLLAIDHFWLNHNSPEILALLTEAMTATSDSYDEATALLYNAVAKASMEIITSLLNHGADPNLEDNMGNTPLRAAMIVSENTVWHNNQPLNYHPELIQLLVDKGAKDTVAQSPNAIKN